jgi:hypothetical protein
MSLLNRAKSQMLNLAYLDVIQRYIYALTHLTSTLLVERLN